MSRLIERRSVSTTLEMPAYCTFTATSRPSCVRARCTCASDADASGARSKLANASSGPVPSSLRTCADTSSYERGGTASCSRLRTATSSGGATSARLLRNWHDLIRSPRIRTASRYRRSPVARCCARYRAFRSASLRPGVFWMRL